MNDAWSEVWRAPVLRALDDPARRALSAAGRIRDLPPGHRIFTERDPADALYVVLEGSVELRAQRRGDEAVSRLRTARGGDTFGEEALGGAGSRRGQAWTEDATRVAELPAALFLRGVGRSGGAPLAERELRRLRRNATGDLLRTMAATRTLAEAELDRVIDAVVPETRSRGAIIYAQGDPADGLWLVVDGLVQLQTETDDKIHVQAYLTRGDGFGDQESLSGDTRSAAAVAMGETRLLRLPASVLRSLVDRNPGLVDAMRRIAQAREQRQVEAVGGAAARSTQHVFKDLYRMQMARSLLVIDQESCVRCGHCAWTCESLYGVSRLVRRGDKILTPMGEGGDALHSLLVPNSCQHCKNPVCMIDCPTGAIGRDLEGEVFIRDALCTGCGNCAKACPWENIRMAPRPTAPRREDPVEALSAELATKCDLCRGYEAPGCVQACPTGSLVRLDPSRDVAEVAAVLGTGASASDGTPAMAGRARVHGVVRGLGVVVGLGLGATGLRLQQVGTWVPGQDQGLVAGIVAAVGMLGLLSYAAPKRISGLWMKRRRKTSAARRLAAQSEGQTETRPVPRSKVRGWLSLHAVLGMLTMAAVLGHAGLRVPNNPAGSLVVAFWAVSVLGIFGAVVYRVVPRRLARLERRGDLPEDLKAERQALLDRLFVRASGRDDLVKTIASRVLVPYARAPLGPLRLLASGRSLAEERARLTVRIDTMRQGRGDARLGGLDELVTIAVQLRALPLRRGLTAGLRGWLPLHIVVSAVALALLGVHVALMLGGP